MTNGGGNKPSRSINNRRKASSCNFTNRNNPKNNRVNKEQSPSERFANGCLLGKKKVTNEYDAREVLQGAIATLKKDPQGGLQLVSHPDGHDNMVMALTCSAEPSVREFFTLLRQDELQILVFGECVTKFLRRIAGNRSVLEMLRKWLEDGEWQNLNLMVWLLGQLVYNKPSQHDESVDERRKDDNILQMVRLLNTSKCSEIEKLHVAFPDIVEVASKSAATGTHIIKDDFSRHDNDSRMISDIRLLPTHDELLCDEEPYLPLADPPPTNFAQLIERHFRWLRQDFVGTLKDSLRMIPKDSDRRRELPKLAARLDSRTYCNVAFGTLTKDRMGMALQVHFDHPEKKRVTNTLLPRWTNNETKNEQERIDKKVKEEEAKQPNQSNQSKQSKETGQEQGEKHVGSQKQKQHKLQVDEKKVARNVQFKAETHYRKYWEDSKGLKRGDLVCICNPSDLKEKSIVAIVADGNRLKDGIRTEDGVCTIALLFASTKELEAAIMSKFEQSHQLVMVELPVPYFTYRPVLERLQAMNALPLADVLVSPTPTRHGILDCGAAILAKYGFVRAKSGAEANALGYDSNLYKTLEKMTAATERKESVSGYVGATDDIVLDEAQCRAVVKSFEYPLALVQGPPGTGKSFVGAMIGKLIVSNSRAKILCVCYTNHALDQFLLDLIRIGVPKKDVARIGNSPKIHEDVKGLQLKRGVPEKRQGQSTPMSRIMAGFYRELKELEEDVAQGMERFEQACEGWAGMNLLLQEIQPSAIRAFNLVEREFQVQKKIKAPQLWKRWIQGKQPPKEVQVQNPSLWELNLTERLEKQSEWLHGALDDVLDKQKQFNSTCKSRNMAAADDDYEQLVGKRIIGCTTVGAAMHSDLLRALQCEVLLVEEAGEVLEAHILGALNDKTDHVIMIGDHKQLRPKVENYDLQVESGKGHDLNVSLFERHVVGGAPFETLEEQHRMRPELAEFCCKLTYPSLRSSPKSTGGRPNLEGAMYQSTPANILFIDHRREEQSLDGSLSKVNDYEVDWTTELVCYLLKQQCYSEEDIVVLTPYLGQLVQIRDALSRKRFSTSVSDRDMNELASQGIASQSDPQKSKGPCVRVSSIDNFQGEEADVIIVSLVRSNSQNDIGFVRGEQRVNVLLSRARNSLIMVGNRQTFSSARKGGGLWRKVFNLFEKNGFVLDGFPSFCREHKAERLVRTPEELRKYCPNGGCHRECGKILPCGHACAIPCHRSKCEGPCRDCEKIKKERMKEEQERQRIAEERKKVEETITKRERAAQVTQQKLQEQQDQLEQRVRLERARAVETMLSRQLNTFENSKADLLEVRKSKVHAYVSEMEAKTAPMSPISSGSSRSTNAPITDGDIEYHPVLDTVKDAPNNIENDTPGSVISPTGIDERNEALLNQWAIVKSGLSEAQRQPVEELFKMIGLHKVKEKALELYKLSDLRDFKPTLNFCFVGNPGTGKTETAKLFAKILFQSGARKDEKFCKVTATEALRMGEKKFASMLTSLVGISDTIAPDSDRSNLMKGTKVEVEDSERGGSWFAATIVSSAGGSYVVEYVDEKEEDKVQRKRIRVPKPKGGVLFVDEAYDLAPASSREGKAILAEIMQAAEEHRDVLTVILAGYEKDIQDKLFAFNNGMASRFEMIQFEDFSELELRRIWDALVDKKEEVTCAAIASSVVARRLSRMRNVKGFGNARQVRKSFEQAALRALKDTVRGDEVRIQAKHIVGEPPNSNPRLAECMQELDRMTGLGAVKKKVKAMVNVANQNYSREMKGLPVDLVTLNRLFIGSPGTGKTTMAHLYGRILKELNFLSSGEVVSKVASDFKGQYVGESENKARAILQEAEGKVLLIDEAYGLNDSLYGKQVLDTIVEKVSGKPGEDIAVVMCGYKDEMFGMLREQNPGLSRRFAKDEAYEFEDFSDDELREIWVKLCAKEGVTVSPTVTDAAVRRLSQQRDCGQFGNAGEVNTLFTSSKSKMLERTGGARRSLEVADVMSESMMSSMQDPLHPLKEFEDSEAKQQLEKLLRKVQKRKERGQDVRKLVSNFVFLGNAGVGKTVTARVVGKVMQGLGLLGSDKVVETSASDIVGQYVGHTKKNMQAKMEEAAGGVLFIDEAYDLGQGVYGKEALTELVGMLTLPKYLGKTVVVLAGYETDMHDMMERNQGLKSRFQEHIRFEDWSPTKCLAVTEKVVREESFDLSREAKAVLLRGFEELSTRPGWANGRDAKLMGKKLIDKLDESDTDSLEISETIARASVEAMKSQRPKPRLARAQIPDSPVEAEQLMQQFNSNPPLQMENHRQRASATKGVEETSLDASEEEEEEEEEGVEDEEQEEERKDARKGPYESFDIKLLNSALEDLGYDQDQGKVDELEKGQDRDLLAEVVEKLKEFKCDDAENLLNEWREALREARDHKQRELQRAKVKNLVPLFMCAVCKRTSFKWVPCPVAPFLWKLVEPGYKGSR